jgi:hypothetical protein
MRSLVEIIPAEALKRLAIACFDTRFNQPSWMTGSAAALMSRKLSKRGASHLLPAASFHVQGTHGPLVSGELERAVAWARMLYERHTVDQVEV